MTNLPTAERIGTLPGRIGASGLNGLGDTAQSGTANRLLFSLSSPETGTELGISDRTPDGTVLFVDIFPNSSGQSPNSASPDRFTPFKGAMFFQARSPLGSDVWFTDGTAEGSQILTDLVPGSQLVVTSPLEVLGDRLLFETYPARNRPAPALGQRRHR
ncbi:MAG: hypothetical protein HC857_08390 [Synechococcales cyanobacterium RU_4_20]|nr:hypothetical protein [Synechococcales cyanobacterium RU_4_20]